MEPPIARYLEAHTLSLSTYRQITDLANIDLFTECKDDAHFVGRPFYFDYGKVFLLINDRQKKDVGGIPEGCFLICTYDLEPELSEVVLVRFIRPAKLPTHDDTIASMVDYYKESAPTATISSPLNFFTRYSSSSRGSNAAFSAPSTRLRTAQTPGRSRLGPTWRTSTRK